MLPKFLKFSCKKQNYSRIGLLLADNTVIDPSEINDKFKESFENMYNLMDDWQNKESNTRSFVDEILEKQNSNSTSSNSMNNISTYNLNEIQIHAPLRPRNNVMCIGKNYTDHIAEVAAVRGKDSNEITEAPKYPVIFTKSADCVIGHDENIPNHSNITKWLDYEAELAVIIGSNVTDITNNEDAWNSIFGYTIGNDVTAREIQKRHTQWWKGKSLNGGCPLGPVIIPASHLSSSKVQNLNISCVVNKEIRQNSNTSKMIFDIPTIISTLSQGYTLRPGDTILTGTPDGVGFAMKPPKCLQAGDVVEVTIENLGTLINKVV